MVIVTLLLLCLVLPAYYYNSFTYESTIIVTNCNVSRQTPGKITPRVDQEATRKQKYDPKSLDIHVKQDPCSGRYIYMHDLPPRFNQNLLKNCHTLVKWYNFCPYVKNDGLGPRINKNSWYHTDQFMLSVIFHNRMKQYECLTRNSSLALAIYAPFYPGLEIRRYLWSEVNSSVKDAEALDFVVWLKKRHEWNRMFGKDHFFVAGRINWDFKRTSDSNDGWGSKLLNLPEVKNMTVLTIESSPYESNEFAIPYPTYFHPWNMSEVLEWQKIVRRATKKRAYLFSFAGASRPNQKQSIRGELISQCKDALNNRCNLVNCMPNNYQCNSPTHIIEMFMKSVFCLQPSGDSYTRRSTFDSILAGCIPVFFHPGSAYIQYLWHLPKNYTKYSVFIPEDGVKNGTVRVQELLSQISEEEVSSMRKEVIRLIPRILYAQKKLDMVEDAFDVAVRKILKRIEDARRLIQEGTEPSNNSSGNLSREYFSEGKLKEWSSFF
ncbi:xyloglucan galactosyltransferase KATAMARI1 homolog [Chenopodium quinoa]|uniref:Exostosin GT47 domain-containing protein n=1 Tax=Chenopodium quinoa TaxID=63459 RepID=A0A803LTF4_CHEQI|nr:xyloglucan galactosyltransferase KATAMARI1 homolog [Chenopodium quinoa]